MRDGPASLDLNGCRPLVKPRALFVVSGQAHILPHTLTLTTNHSRTLPFSHTHTHTHTLTALVEGVVGEVLVGDEDAAAGGREVELAQSRLGVVVDTLALRMRLARGDALLLGECARVGPGHFDHPLVARVV